MDAATLAIAADESTGAISGFTAISFEIAMLEVVVAGTDWRLFKVTGRDVWRAFS